MVGAAAVEAEAELVEVEVELVWADGALMCAELPAFEQRGDAVDTRRGSSRGAQIGSQLHQFSA